MRATETKFQTWGEVVRLLAHEQDMSIRDLARASGLSDYQVIKIKIGDGNARNLRKVMHALGYELSRD
jgi:hypothetical protein